MPKMKEAASDSDPDSQSNTDDTNNSDDYDTWGKQPRYDTRDSLF